jgi:superfamily II DNA or RNA helicase
MDDSFAIILYQHRRFGYIASAYQLKGSGSKEYLEAGDRMHARHTGFGSFQPEMQELIRLCDSISDESLFSRFGTRIGNYTDFFSKVGQDMVDRLIMPFIEKKLLRILNILLKANVALYLTDPRPKRVYKEERVHINRDTAHTIFHFYLNEDSFQYFLTIESSGKEISIFGKPGFILINDPCWLVLNNELLFFPDIDGKKLLPFFTRKAISIPKSAEKKYMETFVLNTLKKYKVRANGFGLVEISPVPSVIFHLEFDLNLNPCFRIKLLYHPGFQPFIDSGVRNQVLLNADDGGYLFTRITRDEKFETDLLSDLEQEGLRFKDQLFYPQSGAAGGMDSVIAWLGDHSLFLSKYQVSVSQFADGKKFLLEKARLKFDIRSENDWFDLYGTVTAGGYTFPFLQLKDHILNGEREYKLPDGTFFYIPGEWMERYSEIFLFSHSSRGALRLSRYHFNLLQELEEEGKERIVPEKLSLQEFLDQPLPVVQDRVKATLRPYQKEGYAWMYYLHRNRFGGCLADDMGLGKTLQTLTLLLAVTPSGGKRGSLRRQQAVQLDLFEQPVGESGVSGHSDPFLPASLVVMPTSLLHNWRNEIARFAPSLSVGTWHGESRQSLKNPQKWFDRFDIVLTSYGTLRIDIEQFKQYSFHYFIADESQFFKNPESRIFQAVTEIRASFRLALTGTPIENSLRDLWSQMEFLNPGLLGSLPFFTRQYIVAPGREMSQPQIDKLKLILQPFILRRTKQQVAHDLPELTIQTYMSTMDEEQEKIYRNERDRIRSQLLNTIAEKGVSKSAVLILRGLQRLRQIACHPSMVFPDSEAGSGKFEEVLMLTSSLLAEGHKILIFSGFVKHLSLFEDYFVQNGIQYSMLTGQTRNREKVIRTFQTDPDHQIFLISIKAGGVGLNLTAADYIFVLDPWWNPAVEMQAINRAHRIGQKKNIFVYRFISGDTIEEKIHRLQESKSALADIFINSNNPFHELGIEDIHNLIG